MNSSISSMAIKAMFWRVLLVITLSSLGGYWYNYSLVRSRTIHDIERYVHERIERESALFTIAEKNLDLMAKKFIKLSNTFSGDANKEFKKLVTNKSDGTYRTLSDDPEKTQILIPKNSQLSDQLKKNLIITENLMTQFGPVLSPHFLNVWMVGKEDYGICYWPSEPGLLNSVSADFSFLAHEYATVGLPENNPSGNQIWAGPYLDLMSKDWMISLNQPVYLSGKYQLSFGMDIILEDFNERSTSNLMQGTYNIIFNKDGRLIVHPEHMGKIKESNGQFFIDKSGDSSLLSIFKRSLNNSGKVIYDADTKLFLGVGKIPNMDWYFVLVYPESKLQSIAMKTAVFVLLIGFLSLLIEMLMLYQVLHNYVSIPIKKLVDATNKISNGNFQSRVDEKIDNEVGQLARSFNAMAKNIEERDALLLDHSQRLEQEVIDRTSELDLQRARSLEASKMATLGEISAGIAHEINNPLQIISLTLAKFRKLIMAFDGNDVQKLVMHINRMDSTVERIKKIIKGLKSFSRNSEGDELIRTPLKSIIENSLVLCQEVIHIKHIAVHQDQIPDIEVMCRETDIIQTLVNLIQNSIDALEQQEEKEISLLFKLVDDDVLIIVEDNGPGVPPDLANKIMNPFFTTKNYGKGTGLGLFISSGLIHANGGRLYLESFGNKTRFIVSLKRYSVTKASI